MCAAVTPQALSSPIASTGRSLFERLTSPLRPRTRNLADFHIQPHEPHRQYSPGDLVKGIVVLTVVKPIRITHLTVSLHGFVRVFKGPSSAVDPTANDALLTASANSRKTQYFGNGQASLFQDEIILCGEGRLEVGVYEFEFNLEFPGKGLPSSIDFERGTICYMIRSTITRPTSISATSSCDRKVSLIETVDIGPLVPPKPRVISLEPISRRHRKHKHKAPLDTDPVEPVLPSDVPSTADSPASDESTSQRGSGDHPTNPSRSPFQSDAQSQSEYSGESVVSSSTGMSFRLAPVPVPPSSKSDSQGGQSSRSGSGPNKTITATIELLKAGCLPGDSIPLKISIQHAKWIKSMHGIIITLYRQGRIDSAPPLSLFEDLKGKAAERLKHEEYYPKSKTGLGGLSLSSAGSSSVFRKDLSQTLAPIILDPKTLSTIITTSIRVPEDVFPTIKGVPGELISFKYHIEVVVDLGGKLAGQDRHLPRLGMINLPSMTNPNGQNAHTNGTNGMLSAWGGNIVNTDHIRREKSVVACLFEIIVGTVDSARIRGRSDTLAKQNVDDVPESPRSLGFSLQQEQQQDLITPTIPEEPPYPHDDNNHYPDQSNHRHDHLYDYYEEQQNYHSTTDSPHYMPSSVPPPEVHADDDLTEKEQLRRAEVRLLPSQPPPDDGPSLSRSIVPTAPEDDEDLYSPQDSIPLSTTSTLQPQTTLTNQLEAELGPEDAPSAPTLEDMEVGEDKQELERQRLMAETSSPADFPTEDDNAGEGSSNNGAQHEPTAPVLTEADEYGGHYSHHALPGPSSSMQHESLPRYQR